MYRKKETVAMLLAGGQGSRLYALTNKIAKPAVPFGAKYRIIDFPMSNCINSGIDTVGVLTQYQPLILNEYLGNGQPWDLDRTFGGVHILSPYQAKSGSEWFKGTANAIYQNLHFIDKYSPDYVLILSGDHVYKMDYSKMLSFHKSNKADCTIASITVPMEEASRFGILNTREGGQIYEFDEKPKKPKSNTASMGIYIFNRDKLAKYLEEDDKSPTSSKDFGKDVLPSMLSAGERMFAYPFSGYWKDVGTIESLLDANMDLLGDKPNFNVADLSWKIHSRNPIAPPHYLGENAHISNSMVALGAHIDGVCENSIIFSNVTIEKGAVVKDSVIMSRSVIKSNAVINYSIIDENVTIGQGCVIGSPKIDTKGIAVIGRDVSVKDNATVDGGVIIDSDLV